MKNYRCKFILMTRPRAASGEPWGKTECWYVAHARPGAQIAWAFKPGVTSAQFEKAINEQRAEELLNWINVFPGEMIYVAGGTVHTLGPGSIIVETQQQSDTTYRLYDYGRPRELHLKEGLAAVKEKVASGKVIRPGSCNVKWNKKSMVAARDFAIFHSGNVRIERRPGFSNQGYSNEREQEFGSDIGCGGRLRGGRSARRRAGHAGKG